MDEEAYHQFLGSYKTVIVKIIEEGYTLVLTFFKVLGIPLLYDLHNDSFVRA